MHTKLMLERSGQVEVAEDAKKGKDDSCDFRDNKEFRSEGSEGDAVGVRKHNSLDMRDVLMSLLLLGLVALVTQEGRSNSTEPNKPSTASQPLRVRPFRKASRSSFFPKGSYLDDYDRGQLEDAEAVAKKYDSAFFMGYATWDADSQYARSTFVKIAREFRDSGTYFAAIDCWYPDGQCSKRRMNTTVYGRKLPFPMFFFYPRSGSDGSTIVSDRRTVLVYRGPVVFENIVKFLSSARRPVIGINSIAELYRLRALQGGSLFVGYFPNLLHDPKVRDVYNVFLHTAYSLLEADPSGTSGGFGAVFSKSMALSLGLGSISHSVRFLNWNGKSNAFPYKKPSYVSFLRWASGNVLLNSLTSWIGPSGSKSNLLEDHLMSGTGNSLVVILYGRNRPRGEENFRAFLEAAFRYKHCMVNQTYFKFKNAMLKSFQELCTHHRHDYNLTSDCDVGDRLLFRTEDGSKAFKSEADGREEVFGENAWALDGLACRDNRTLDFFSVDVETQEAFMRRLGLQPSIVPHAIIVSMKSEVVYVMNRTSGSHSLLQHLSDFVEAFHHNVSALEHLQMSSEVPILPKVENLGGSNIRNPQETTNVIEEINASGFKDLLASRDTFDILLYQTDGCVFCTAGSPLSQVYHTVSRLFAWMNKDNDVRARFMKIDASRNDLPFEFKAFSVPTILLFPAVEVKDGHSSPCMAWGRLKRNSYLFPEDMPLTIANLIGFILLHLPMESRLKLSLNICDEKCRKKALENVSQKQLSEFALRTTNQMVGDTLQLRRLNEVKKMLERSVNLK